MGSVRYRVTKVDFGGSAVWMASLGQLQIIRPDHLVTATWEPGDEIELVPADPARNSFTLRRIGSIEKSVAATLVG